MNNTWLHARGSTNFTTVRVRNRNDVYYTL